MGAGRGRPARLIHALLGVRFAEDDPAVERDRVKLEAEALAILGGPGDADAVPVPFAVLAVPAPGRRCGLGCFLLAGRCFDDSDMVFLLRVFGPRPSGPLPGCEQKTLEPDFNRRGWGPATGCEIRSQVFSFPVKALWSDGDKER